MKTNELQCEIFLLLMEHYIQDMEEKLLQYELQDKINDLLKDYAPPPLVNPIPISDPYSLCPKCGLQLNQVMGYCCPNPKCPTGLGPVMS